MAETDLSEAVAQAKAALEQLRAALGDLVDVGRLEPPLRAAGENLVDAVRRRPFSALGIAFCAGLALALLTRS